MKKTILMLIVVLAIIITAVLFYFNRASTPICPAGGCSTHEMDVSGEISLTVRNGVTKEDVLKLINSHNELYIMGISPFIFSVGMQPYLLVCFDANNLVDKHRSMQYYLHPEQLASDIINLDKNTQKHSILMNIFNGQPVTSSSLANDCGSTVAFNKSSTVMSADNLINSLGQGVQIVANVNGTDIPSGARQVTLNVPNGEEQRWIDILSKSAIIESANRLTESII